MDVQIAGPPAFSFHLDKATHFDKLRISRSAGEREVSGLHAILWARFQLKRVGARRQSEDNGAIEDEMIIPKGNLGRLDRLSLGIFQVHPRGDRPASLLVDYLHLQFPLATG